MIKPSQHLVLVLTLLFSFAGIAQEIKVHVHTAISEDYRHKEQSPNGKLLAIKTEQNIQVWDVKRQKRIYKMNPFSGYVMDFDFSPDSKCLIISSENGEVIVWDLVSDEKIWERQFYKYGCEQVAFHPLDNHVIFVLGDSLSTWNINENKPLQSMDRVSRFRIGPNGNYIAVRKSNELHICDLSSLKTLLVNDRHQVNWGKAIEHYSFDESGEYFYSLGKEDSSVVLVNLKKMEIEAVVKLPNSDYSSVSINEKKELILSKEFEKYPSVFTISGEKLWPREYYEDINEDGTIWRYKRIDTTGRHLYFEDTYVNEESEISEIQSTFNVYERAQEQYDYLLLEERGQAQWLDIELFKEVYSYSNEDAYLTCELSNDGKKLVIVDGPIVRVFSITDSGLDSNYFSVNEDVLKGGGIINASLINDDQDLMFMTSSAEVLSLNLSSGELLNFELPIGQQNKRIFNFEYNTSLNYAIGQSYSENLWSGANRIIVWNSTTGKILAQFEHHSEIEHFSLSPDGEMLVFSDANDLFLYRYQEGHFHKLNSLTQNTFWSFYTDLSFDPTGELILAASSDKDIVLIPVSKFASFGMTASDAYLLKGHKNVVQNLAFPRDENYFLSTSDDNTMKEWNISNGKLITDYTTGELQLIEAFYNENNEIVTIGSSGEITVWDRENRRPKHTNYMVGDSRLTLLPNGYYKTNSKLAQEVYFTKGLSVFLFEQFDLKYNRPDLVLRAEGSDDEELINAYHSAYQKRLKKMGFTEDMLEDDFHLPEIEIENFEEMPSLHDQGSINLKLKLQDSKYKLDRINVWVNDVAIYGTNGISLRDKNVQEYQTELEVFLAKGKNKVQVSVLNQAGAESYKETFEVECTLEKINRTCT
jgi:WD40 repeat protein